MRWIGAVFGLCCACLSGGCLVDDGPFPGYEIDRDAAPAKVPAPFGEAAVVSSEPQLAADPADAAGPVEPNRTVTPALAESSDAGAAPSIVDASLPEPTDAGQVFEPPVDTTPELPILKSVTFSVTTTPAGGRYQPKNIGAIWLEREDGSFVRTLELWARVRRSYLSQWKAASGSDATDALTSATRSSHSQHTVTWDLTDLAGNEVPDGRYRLRVELTDQNGPGPTVEVDVDKGPAFADQTPADQASFHQMRLTGSW